LTQHRKISPLLRPRRSARPSRAPRRSTAPESSLGVVVETHPQPRPQLHPWGAPEGTEPAGSRRPGPGGHAPGDRDRRPDVRERTRELLDQPQTIPAATAPASTCSRGKRRRRRGRRSHRAPPAGPRRLEHQGLDYDDDVSGPLLAHTWPWHRGSSPSVGCQSRWSLEKLSRRTRGRKVSRPA